MHEVDLQEHIGNQRPWNCESLRDRSRQFKKSSDHLGQVNAAGHVSDGRQQMHRQKRHYVDSHQLPRHAVTELSGNEINNILHESLLCASTTG